MKLQARMERPEWLSTAVIVWKYLNLRYTFQIDRKYREVPVWFRSDVNYSAMTLWVCNDATLYMGRLFESEMSVKYTLKGRDSPNWRETNDARKWNVRNWR